MNPINERLKAIRLAKGLTQKDFAENVLKVKRSYYSEVEAGKKRSVSAKIMRQLIDNYNVAADFLMTGKGEMFVKSEHDEKDENVGQSNKENSQKVDTLKSGENVGLDVGLKKMDKVLISYSRRLFRDLKKSDFRNSEYLKSILFLSEFHDFIGEFENEYLGEVRKILYTLSLQTPGSKIPYRQYKENLLKALEKIEDYKPLLNKLESDIKQFYQEFQQFDTKNIIEDYYDPSED